MPFNGLYNIASILGNNVPGKDKKRRPYESYRQIGIVTVIPMIMAVGPLFGYFVGTWLDKKLGTEPYLLIVMIILGFIASGKETYRLIKQAQESTEKK